MILIRTIYDCPWRAGESIHVPVRNKYSLFFFPEPVEIRLGDELIVTKPNAVILSGPDEPRWYYFRKDTRFHFLHATLDIRAYLEKYDIPCGSILYPENPEAISKLLWKLRVEYLSQNPYRDDLLDAQLQELMICLSRRIHSDRSRFRISNILENKLQQLRLHMLSQPEADWSVEALAKSVSLSVSRFHVVYRSVFGVSPIRDLIAARVERAKVLLLEYESDTLAQISEELGYKNQYDFSRQFKRVTGIAPGTYRRQNK